MARELELRPKIQKQWKSLILVSSRCVCSLHSSCFCLGGWQLGGVANSVCTTTFSPKTTAELELSPEIPAIFGVYAPDYMSQFKVKTTSLFVLFAFLERHLHFLYPSHN